jgi:Na+(H+)/acetate symporter ActP
MITIKIIALCWTVLMSLYALVAKINGAGVLVILLVKLFSLITLAWSGYELFKMLP